MAWDGVLKLWVLIWCLLFSGDRQLAVPRWELWCSNCGDEVDLEPVTWMLKFWLTVVSCSRVRVYGVLGEAGVCEPG